METKHINSKYNLPHVSHKIGILDIYKFTNMIMLDDAVQSYKHSLCAMLKHVFGDVSMLIQEYITTTCEYIFYNQQTYHFNQSYAYTKDYSLCTVGVKCIHAYSSQSYVLCNDVRVITITDQTCSFRSIASNGMMFKVTDNVNDKSVIVTVNRAYAYYRTYDDLTANVNEIICFEFIVSDSNDHKYKLISTYDECQRD